MNHTENFPGAVQKDLNAVPVGWVTQPLHQEAILVEPARQKTP